MVTALLIKQLENSQKVSWADFDPREQYIVSIDENTVKLWDLDQSRGTIKPSYYCRSNLLQVARTLEFPKIKLSAIKRNSLAYHPFAHIVALRFEESPVQIWDLKVSLRIYPLALLLTPQQSRTLLQTLPESLGSGPITFSPDGRWVCAVNNTGLMSVQVWDMATAQVVFSHPLTSSINSAVFSPTDIALVLAGQSGAVEIWDLANSKQLNENAQEAHADAITALVFAPESSVMIGMTANGLRSFEWPTGQCLDQVAIENDEWKTISELTHVAHSPYLIGCAVRDNKVSTWVVDPTVRFIVTSID